MANTCPAILVHGLFGWGPSEAGGFPYWGTGVVVPCPLPRYVASVGPISSNHDRACELAYQIKGGRVDYGQEHSAGAQHKRRGRAYGAGLYPQWSQAHPVHLIGHSMGAPTIWMLQHLLAIDYFGWGSNADWVTSINCISGVLNGSTATYFLGCDERTGLIEEALIPHVVKGAIELYTSITGDVFERFYDFDLDQWGFRRAPSESLADYLTRICSGPFFRGQDNAVYCLTIQGMLLQNALCATHANTYYFSYVTEQTYKGFLTGRYLPEPSMNPFMLAPSFYIGSKVFDAPFYHGFRSPDWWPNDGLVSTYAQEFPRIAGKQRSAAGITKRHSFQAGVWYHETLESVDHIDIVALPQLDQIGFQKEFYTSLFERLASL